MKTRQYVTAETLTLIARLWSIVASFIIGYADYDKDYSGFITFLLRKDAYRCEVVKLAGAS